MTELTHDDATDCARADRKLDAKWARHDSPHITDPEKVVAAIEGWR